MFCTILNNFFNDPDTNKGFEETFSERFKLKIKTLLKIHNITQNDLDTIQKEVFSGKNMNTKQLIEKAVQPESVTGIVDLYDHHSLLDIKNIAVNKM